ncbi:MAG: sugar transferase [Chloroflexi bacterium]|nr:sugar transferase [Chloroflexota bacterium]
MSSVFSQTVKRLFDIAVSFTALIFLSPVFGLLAVAIKRDSPGPVFYGGNRIGKGGKIFRIWKFRTMYEDRKSYEGPRVTAKGDERITPLGKWLRDTKLNELPQFYNVLKGEMSMVGPRPEDPSFAETWSDDVRADVLSVRPGITSPATVVYHDEESILSSGNLLQKYIHEIGPDKARLDQMYVRYRSFMLDLDVILWTFLILLPRIRSQTPPEELLFVGPISRLFKRYMSWGAIDLIITFSSIFLSGLVWGKITPIATEVKQAVSMALVFSIIFSLVGTLMGVNRISWSKATTYDSFRIIPAWLVATGIATYVNWALGVLPVGLILIASVVSLAGYVFLRNSKRMAIGLLSRTLKFTDKAERPRERVIIVGSGRTAEHIAGLLDHPSNVMKYQVVGIVDDDLMSQGMDIYGKKVLGRTKDLCVLIKKYRAQVVFLASHTLDMNKEIEIADFCAENGVKAVVIPDIFGSLQKLSASNGDDQLAYSQLGNANLRYAGLEGGVSATTEEVETNH